MIVLTQKIENSAIAAAARHLAEAEAAESKARAAAKAVQDRRDQVACRIADLEAQRAAIVSRRAGGHMKADDGSHLALFVADTEGLNGLLADANQQVAAMQTAYIAATRTVQNASLALAHARDAVLMSLLMTHFSDLDAAMLKVLGELASVAGRLGIANGRPAWGATPALYHRLRILAAQRGEL